MIYGCIGEHLIHSFSADIHRKIGLYPYELRDVKREELDAFMTARAFAAINVTIPYKEQVIPHLYEISDKARAIGAVNTIVNRAGKLYGYNTDFWGMSTLVRRAQINISGKKVLILGTGGTSKTAMAVMRDMGALDIVRVSRTAKEDAVSYEEAKERHQDADILLNTTPCGMFPHPWDMPIDPACFPRLSGVIDVIYNPLRTKLVLRAKELGIPAVGGLEMLVAQALAAAEIFTGNPLDAGVFERIAREVSCEKENIVLIGMPSAGKSTVGAQIAAITGRKFIDTDETVQAMAGCSARELIETHDEPYFRDRETEAIQKAAMEHGAVIATGGGAILREENVAALRQNGRLYWLDRPLEALCPTADRPLAANKDAMGALYRVRAPFYASVADERIAGNEDIRTVAEEIVRKHT